jgi:LuxR family maltose regulon positive regulatory protein
VQRIVELTEGWPAALYLGALSLRERVDPGAFIAEFAGSNRHIVDYLASEVLQRLTDTERTFLLRTSILDSFTDALCSAVVSGTDTTGLLAEIELHNLFPPLDGQRRWFRCHSLQELLQLKLARTTVGACPPSAGRPGSPVQATSVRRCVLASGARPTWLGSCLSKLERFLAVGQLARWRPG